MSIFKDAGKLLQKIGNAISPHPSSLKIERKTDRDTRISSPSLSNPGKATCSNCEREFTKKTLAKYGGLCGRCNTCVNGKKSIPKKVRHQAWKIHVGNCLEGRCYSCDKVIYFEHFEAGHVLSEYNGGEISVSNIRPICVTCNRSCGVMNLDEFKKMLSP